MRKKEYSTEVGGKTLTAEFSDLAEQANGSVLIRYGNTVLLATAVMSNGAKEGGDWFPLTVDYEERFYAAGKILGSRFVRREGRPTEEAILSGRIVDRTIRPLFDQYIRHEVQVVITVLSIEQDDPDVLGVVGASLALATSNIPWNGPVSAVRIGIEKETGAFTTNPTYKVRDGESIAGDIVACGKDGNINMIEVGGKEITEETLVASLKKASEEIEALQAWQKKIVAEIGKQKKVIPAPEIPKELIELFKKNIEEKLPAHVMSGKAGHYDLYEIKGEWMELFKTTFPEVKPSLADSVFENKVNEIIHVEAVENNRRPDNRKMDELRPLFAQAGKMSPLLHGTGIFYRGGTHIFSALTLGGPGDSQIVEGMEFQTKKRFMHHYNFPPFSTGECGRIGSTNRRMIGHGALAEKALQAVLPTKESFPYTVRIVSEAFSSNGSTSMGSVCGSTLALMDAGVPIIRPVAGIASGLMMENSKSQITNHKQTSNSESQTPKYKILTDIQGPEDHHGDMDFKVAGTRKGVTAVQMDVKVGGIPIAILAEAFEKAKQARFQILDVMEAEIKLPRPDISPYAPKILVIKINPKQIGLVIGTGGKTINEIRDTTGVDGIDIEEDGTVFITGKNGTAEAAKKIIEEMTHEYKAGDRLTGTVVKIAEFGAFVSLNANTDGMVHVSEIAPFRIDRVEAVLKVGDKVPVVVKEIDAERGRIKLSIKDADPNFIKRPTQK
ncbi:MAG: Polyribonucleotide nucleotidyltransferase [Candidatus Magasanikbacteria bacterium GW2011_GWA2_46_17]|uniref:Polyribonucleotide nucleotidyltransferase n=1 Tax=Candidatus Magasanikbacteria bacterium GW2011_GWA2_46_17 TaxID=1619042 RepID=A0A0G1R919_9BACT|nr:MAG: Polyribonucleotide nucleotidyltransferase [Candidatus Magasanikbacteria bacterium GW2011_GWA2_46_17]